MDGSSATLADWLQAIFAGVLLILTYFYVRTTGRQLAAMRDALEETRRSNTATEKSNEIAERSLEIGNRAWLVASVEDSELAGALDIQLRNVGAVPATDVLARHRFFQELPESIPPLDPPDHGTVVASGDTPRFAIGMLPKNCVVLYCEVDYRDVFERSRKTTACWQHGLNRLGVAEWMLAPKYNRME